MPTPDSPRSDDPDGRPDDGWSDAPDRWAEADRAYEEKWAEPSAEAPPAGYVPAKATPKAVHDAYGDGMRAAGPHLGLGVQIAASMALFVGGGILVDRWLGTTPWGVIVGAVLGMAGILVLVVRVSREADRKKR